MIVYTLILWGHFLNWGSLCTGFCQWFLNVQTLSPVLWVRNGMKVRMGAVHSPILSPRWQRSLPARLEEGSRALDKHGPNLVGSVCGERGEAFFKNLSVKVLLGKVSETYFLGWIWVHTLYLMWTKEYIALGRGVKISREGKDYWLKAKSVLRCLTNMERSFRCCAMTTCDHLVGSPQVMCLQLAPLLTVSSFEICRIRACFTSLVLSQFL